MRGLDMKKEKIFRIAMINIAFFLFMPVLSKTDYFEKAKQHFLETDGKDLRYHQEAVWAYLEKLRLGQIDPETYIVYDQAYEIKRPVGDWIHDLIRCWGSSWYEKKDGKHIFPPYTYAWNFAAWQEHLMLCWILYKYGYVIRQEDKDFIENVFSGLIGSRDICPGNPNAQLADFVARYLYCQDHKNIRVQYSQSPPVNNNINTFKCDGRKYEPGEEYNAYEFTGDWLNNRIDS